MATETFNFTANKTSVTVTRADGAERTYSQPFNDQFFTGVPRVAFAAYQNLGITGTATGTVVVTATAMADE